MFEIHLHYGQIWNAVKFRLVKAEKHQNSGRAEAEFDEIPIQILSE